MAAIFHYPYDVCVCPTCHGTGHVITIYQSYTDVDTSAVNIEVEHFIKALKKKRHPEFLDQYNMAWRRKMWRQDSRSTSRFK